MIQDDRGKRGQPRKNWMLHAVYKKMYPFVLLCIVYWCLSKCPVQIVRWLLNVMTIVMPPS